MLTNKEFAQLTQAYWNTNGVNIVGSGFHVHLESVIRLLARFTDPNPIVTFEKSKEGNVCKWEFPGGDD
jgi:hypothetical protein